MAFLSRKQRKIFLKLLRHLFNVFIFHQEPEVIEAIFFSDLILRRSRSDHPIVI